MGAKITVAVISTTIIVYAGVCAYSQGASAFQLGTSALCYGATLVALAVA